MIVPVICGYFKVQLIGKSIIIDGGAGVNGPLGLIRSNDFREEGVAYVIMKS
jgi:hypothetical protein